MMTQPNEPTDEAERRGSDGSSISPAIPPRRPSIRPRAESPGPESHLADTSPVELIVLSVKERAARCRLLSSDRAVTLRARRLWDVVPGEIITVKPRSLWRYGRSQYLAGDIVGTRLDVTALGLTPLRLEPTGTWDPAEEYWGEDVGVRIGEISLHGGTTPVLRWGCIDNRPFLRCLNGYGLCLWQLGRWDEAAAVFDRMLWLNPSDNQGTRFLLPAVRARDRWQDDRW